MKTHILNLLTVKILAKNISHCLYEKSSRCLRTLFVIPFPKEKVSLSIKDIVNRLKREESTIDARNSQNFEYSFTPSPYTGTREQKTNGTRGAVYGCAVLAYPTGKRKK